MAIRQSGFPVAATRPRKSTCKCAGLPGKRLHFADSFCYIANPRSNSTLMVYSPCFGRRDLVFHFMSDQLRPSPPVIDSPSPIRQPPAHERRYSDLCMLPPGPIIAHISTHIFIAHTLTHIYPISPNSSHNTFSFRYNQSTTPVPTHC